MKALTNLKLCALALVLTAGMTSCLKTSDPDFMVVPDVYYLQQSGSSATCTFSGKTYYFTDVPTTVESYYDFMEIDPYMSTPVDTVTSGLCVVQAVSAEDEPRTASAQISFRLLKPLGEFNVESFEYDAEKQTVTGIWNKVENATSYALMYRTSPSQTWAVYMNEFTTREENGKLNGTLSLSIESGTSLEVAVAAVNGSYFLIKNKTTFSGK